MQPLGIRRLWTAAPSPRTNPGWEAPEQKERPLLSPIAVLSPAVPAFGVAPQVLHRAVHPLVASAAELRAALPALDAAWIGAAQTLHGCQTAQALHDCRRAVSQTLGACADEVVRLAAALQASSAVYAQADTGAVGGGG